MYTHNLDYLYLPDAPQEPYPMMGYMSVVGGEDVETHVYVPPTWWQPPTEKPRIGFI